MAYLVTGGTGYLGSYVVRGLLKAGKEVVCLQRSGVTRTAREIIGEGDLAAVKIVQGDVTDVVQLLRVIKENAVDLVVHIGYTMPPMSEDQPANALRVNSLGMNNILEAARLFGLRRVVWASAGAVLGRVGEFYREPIVDDDALYMPASMYAATKVLNETMARLYFEKFGVDSIGFRLPLVYGIGRYHGAIAAFTDFLRKAALNLPLTMLNGDHYRCHGYVYIEDAAAAFVTACDCPQTKTRVFNLVESNCTNREMAEIMRRVNPDAQVTLEETGAHGHPPAIMDTTGARTQLPWEPKYSMEQGFREVFNYFRKKEGLPLL